jgi:hypothetical protein
MADIINGSTISGPVTFLLTNATYNESSLALGALHGASSVNTVTIRPASGNTSCAINLTDDGSNGGGFTMYGTQWVTIEGTAVGQSAGAQNLTISMVVGDAFNDGDAPVALYNGCSNITVSDVNIPGNSSGSNNFWIPYYGVGLPDATPSVGIANNLYSPAGVNSNITVNHCVLTGGMTGVHDFGDGDPTVLGTGPTDAASDTANFDSHINVTNCNIGGAYGAVVWAWGVELWYTNDAYVANNNINGINIDEYDDYTDGTRQGGVFVCGLNNTISSNSISNVTQQSGGGPYGSSILGSVARTYGVRSVGPGAFGGITTVGDPLNTAYEGVATNNVIENNTITNINGVDGSSSGFSSYGVEFEAGNSDQLLYNSIYLSQTASAVSGTGALGINCEGSLFTPENAICINNAVDIEVGQPGGNSNTDLFTYDFWMFEEVAGVGPYDYSGSSNNNVYATNQFVWYAVELGYAVTDQYQLATGYQPITTGAAGIVQPAGPANDGASLNTPPEFTSASNLHINTALATSAYHEGQALASVTVDHDGNPRGSAPTSAGAYNVASSTGSPVEVATYSIIGPTAAPYLTGTVIPIATSTINLAAATVTSVNVNVTITDQSSAVVYNNNMPIASLGSFVTDTVSFPSFTPTYNSVYTVTATSTASGDEVAALEATQTTINVPAAVNYPYHSGFETMGDQAGWGLSGDFAFGSVSGANGPQSTKLGGAHGGDVYAVTVPGAPGPANNTGGTSGYTAATASRLTSPPFNFLGMTKGYISFYQSIQTEPTWDRSIVEYTVDTGKTWHTLGTLNDPNGINWYATAVYASAAGSRSPNGNGVAGPCYDTATAKTVGFPAQAVAGQWLNDEPNGQWTSSGNCGANGLAEANPSGPNGYIFVQYNLAGLTGASSPFNKNFVQFRYTTFSDASGTNDGWAVDDFSVDTVGASPTAASFSGQLVVDQNGNGVIEAGDTVGVGGLTVNFLYFGNPSGQSGAADGDGHFSFNMALPGVYSLSVPSTTYYTTTFPSDNYAATGISSSGNQVGLYNGFIAGTKYNDLNNDRSLDGSEAGLGGWTIEIHKDSVTGALVSKGVTPSNGQFSVPVPPGNYYVIEDTVSGTGHRGGWRLTQPIAGSYNVSVSGLSGSGTAAHSGENFGDFQLCREQLFFNNDLNGDGVRSSTQDVTQLPFFGAITIMKGATTIAADSMGFANKAVSVSDLDTGTYSIRWTGSAPSNWTKTYGGPHTLVVSTSSTFDTTAFLAFEHYSVTGLVYNDHNADQFNEGGDEGVSGVVVSLAGSGTSTTDSNGYFSFSNVDTGSHLMTAAHGAGRINLQNAAGVTVHDFSGVNDNTDNFGLFSTVTVSGSVYSDYNDNDAQDVGEGGASGIQVIVTRASTVTSDTTTTDSHGNFSFAAIDTGHWHVSFTPSAGDVGTQGASGYTFLTTSGSSVAGNVFGQYHTANNAAYYTLTADSLTADVTEKSAKTKSGKGAVGTSPNVSNALDKLLASAGSIQVGVAGINFPGSTKAQAYIVPKKSKDVFTSFFAKGLSQTGTPSGLLFNAKGAFLSKKQTSIGPNIENNKLIADQLALKVNLALSSAGITPAGLGSLVINDGGAYQGWTVAAFAAHADTLMTDWENGTPAIYLALDNTAAEINGAFSGAFSPNDSAWLASAAISVPGSKSVANVGGILLSPKAPAPTAQPNGIVKKTLPTTYALHQNYPNPFNPTTTISYDLPKTSVVTLKVYNMLGQLVTTLFDHSTISAGTQQVTFNANNYASGVYFYHLTAVGAADAKGVSTFDEIKKMVLVK